LAAPAVRSPVSASKSAFPYVVTGAFALTFLVSLQVAGVHPRLLVEGDALENAARFIRGALPPKLAPDFLALMARPAAETIQISVMGMVIAILIGAPLGLLATSSWGWRGVLHERVGGTGRWRFGLVAYGGARAALSVFRSIPEYVWALMFVRAVGLGPFPGVLAIGVAYGGMLGKVYSEILEGVDPRPLETLQAGGASRLGVVLYGFLPEALPSLVSYTLYRWECAIRASAIMGFVGAGGLGQQIELSMRMVQFDVVVTLLAMLFVLVMGVDFVSARIRARVVR